MAYPKVVKVRAIRGATQVEGNSVEAISAGTAELLSEILSRNGLSIESVISVILTATPDLTATFPAVGAREVGFGATPLMCAVEMDVEGALERVVRVMLHCEWSSEEPQHHVYLHGAIALRRDIAQ